MHSPKTNAPLPADTFTEGMVISFIGAFLQPDEPNPTTQTCLQQLFTSTGICKVQPEALADVEYVLHRINKNLMALLLPGRTPKTLPKILLIYLSSQVEKNNVATTGQPICSDLIQHFQTLPELHFRQQKMVSEYAGHMFVTPNYLNEVIKKSTGYSAGHHICWRVVLEAKRMVQLDSSMKQTAYCLGFSDTGISANFLKWLPVKTYIF